MGMSNILSNGLLLLFFNGTGLANIADNAGTSPLTTLYISLHSADPGTAGDQTTNEIGYGTYARVSVARTAAGWSVSGHTASPVANIVFPAPGASAGQTASFIGIGASLSGAGVRYLSGALTPTIPITAGVAPTITTGSQITFS